MKKCFLKKNCFQNGEKELATMRISTIIWTKAKSSFSDEVDVRNSVKLPPHMNKNNYQERSSMFIYYLLFISPSSSIGILNKYCSLDCCYKDKIFSLQIRRSTNHACLEWCWSKVWNFIIFFLRKSTQFIRKC